jgi:hypothetical protein
MRNILGPVICISFAVIPSSLSYSACVFCRGGALSIDKPLDRGGGLSIDKPFDRGGGLSIDKPFDKGGALSIDKPFDKGGSLSIDKVECGGDVCKTLEKAAKDTVAETNRGIKNIGDAGQAVEHFVEHEIHGVGKSLSDAEKRIREGKVVDAFWHFATDPAKNAEENAAQAMQESNILRTVGAVAATAYGGPGGAAAYAAWLTYKQTGNPELALKVGLIAGATSAGFSSVASMPSDTAGQVANKALLAGAIGGTAVAAAGGDKQAVWEGFLRSGGMMLVQDGYRRVTDHRLDDKEMEASKGQAYCMQTLDTNAECAPPAGAYIRDKDGNILKDADGHYKVDVTKTDPYRPHVGQWSDVKAASWTEERSTFMTSVSRVPGMNAMSVFHDQWAVSWDMNTMTSVGTIVPATVLTYIGTGAPEYDLIAQAGVSADQKKVAASGPAQPVPPAPQQASAPDKAKATASFICTKDKAVHRLVVEAPTADPAVACKAYYFTDTDSSVRGSPADSNACDAPVFSAVAEHVNEKWDCVGN